MVNSEVADLVKRLDSNDPFERSEAARQLVNLRAEALEALPRLLELSNDNWWQVRVQVARAVMHFEIDSETKDRLLNKLLNDGDSVVRRYAKEAQQARL